MTVTPTNVLAKREAQRQQLANAVVERTYLHPRIWYRKYSERAIWSGVSRTAAC